MTTGAASPPSVSVIICAYTSERWDLLQRSIESVERQSMPAAEIILVIDHNRELFDRCRERWPESADHDRPDMTVVENAHAGRLGSARTTGAERATGEILAFLDDDAAAEPDWLEHLIAGYRDPAVVAIGGAPLPTYGTARPRWFPYECDWVFGCAYAGLPETTAPIRHVIGANMSVRRSNLLAIGCFHSDQHDDMDMCHRLLDQSPTGRILYEPTAIVHHYVHPERLTWAYFWRRCFFVNRGKVGAFRHMDSASNLIAERAFARRALTVGVKDGVRQWLTGDIGGLLRVTALAIALGLGGLGYAVGTLEAEAAGWFNRRQRPCSASVRKSVPRAAASSEWKESRQ